MSKYADQEQSRSWIPAWFSKAFENSEAFHPLKTISRMMGLLFLLIAFLVIKDPFITLISFPAGVLFMDALFFAFEMKDSTYKSSTFFRKAKTAASNMDKYNLWMFIIKGIAFAVFIPYGQIYGYGAVCLLFPLAIAPITGFSRFQKRKGSNGFIDEEHKETSLTPPGFDKNLYGAHGFGISGSYKGDGSIGGMSG